MPPSVNWSSMFCRDKTRGKKMDSPRSQAENGPLCQKRQLRGRISSCAVWPSPREVASSELVQGLSKEQLHTEPLQRVYIHTPRRTKMIWDWKPFLRFTNVLARGHPNEQCSVGKLWTNDVPFPKGFWEFLIRYCLQRVYRLYTVRL